MPTVTFDEVSLREQRRVPCANGCGKKLTRSRTFTQTINPYNKNAAGEPKTRTEIYAELKAEAASWSPVATCPKCTEQIEGPKVVPPADIVVYTPAAGGSPMLHRSVFVRAAGTVAVARDQAAERIRADIATLQARLDAINEWTYHCYPREKCKHGDAPCFPEAASADAGQVA